MASNKPVTGHERVETSNFLLIVLILLTVIWGGIVEIVPLFFQKSTTQPIAGLKPYTALQLAGRDVYQREGCYLCHSQMIRPFRGETLRYGPYSVAGEFVYDHPFQWGSKRTGPDLQRVGGRYSDDWHRVHMMNPRDVVPESVMPSYPWLAKAMVDPAGMAPRMKALRFVGVPYTDAEIAAAGSEVKGKTELDALVSYLQVLGIARSNASAALPVAAGADDTASVKVENGLVKFYFASGKADLAAGAAEALADAAKAAKEGKKLNVSGFHDATGNPEANAELAKQRAIAVRDALVALGVDAAQIDLVKPVMTEGTGSNAEARRVEVSVQ